MMPRAPLVVHVTSDTVCPWCFVGKRHLEAAIEACRKDGMEVEVRWHPFQLNPSAAKQGVSKREFYEAKFGAAQATGMERRMREIFSRLGCHYSLGGLTGNTLDSHRLILLAGQHGAKLQNALVEELFLDYFTREKFIGDKDVLLNAAERVGVPGAADWLADANAGLTQVQEDATQCGKNV